MVIRIDDKNLQQAVETRFRCACCGACCKGDGIVRLSAAELDRMAEALDVTRRQFVKTYAVQVRQNQWVLRDRLVPRAGAAGETEKWCIFLERRADGGYGCQLHEAKPRQCRSFPAQWLNEDSYDSCAALRALKASLRPKDQP